jgi:hypothetical protein
MNKYWLLFLLIFPCAVSAKILYVNNSGSPACSDNTTYASNSSTSPWCSLLRATWGNTTRTGSSTSSQAAQAGDLVLVSAGTYQTTNFNNSQPVYLPANNGTLGNPIIFRAVGTVELTTTGAPGSDVYNDGSPIIGAWDSGSYSHWDGFTINQSNINYRGGYGLVEIRRDGVEVTNCNIIGAYQPRYPWGGDQHIGVFAQGGNDGPQLAGLVIRNCRISGFTGGNGRNDSAITMYWMDSAIIENNEIFDSQTGIYAKTSDYDSTSVVIRKNLFRNIAGDSVSMQSHANWRFYQNIFRDGGGFSFFPAIYQNGTDKPRWDYVVNNTFDNTSYGIFFNDDGGCAYMNNNHVKNNIFTNTGSTMILSECIQTTDLNPDDVHFNRNSYGVFTNFFQLGEGGTYYSFSQWQGATFQQDANSLTGVNPLYVNESANDFRLQAGSPVLSLGVDILDLDNDGNTSDTIPAGAYITGNEIIGVSTSSSSILNPPTNFRIN